MRKGVGRAARGRRAPAIEVLGSALLVLVACWLAGLRLNLTGSLPLGLYRTVPGPLVRGSLVLVCLPPRLAALARIRRYLPPGAGCPGGILPVGKPLLAWPGDTITDTIAGLRGTRLLG